MTPVAPRTPPKGQKPKRKVKNRPEQDLQKACVRWFRHQYPNEILIHVPNGGKRNEIEAKQFKAMGVTPGFPDLALLKKKGDYGALFIEMKSKDGDTSESQDEMLLKLSQYGYKTAVCNSIDKFMEIVNNYLRKEF